MEKYIKRTCLLVVVFASLLSMLCAAYAADTCRLELSFTPEEKAAEGVRFRVYKVADLNSKYDYVIKSVFKTETVVKLLEEESSANYALAASTIASMISADSSIVPDAQAYTDANGKAVFEALPKGLYLVYGDVYERGDYVYTPHSFLVCLPEFVDGGLLNYDVKANIKWEKRQADIYVNLSVVKIWSDSAVNLHLNDKVKIAIFKNGELFETKVLSKDNNWRYEWRVKTGKDTWTVYEEPVYGYFGTVERQGDCFVVRNFLPVPGCLPYVKLPQTGLLWWPVPILFVLGMVSLIIGLSKKGSYYER